MKKIFRYPPRVIEDRYQTTENNENKQLKQNARTNGREREEEKNSHRRNIG